MTQSRMSYSTTLKLNQRFETYEEFLNVLNTESKKNFDIWTKVDSRKNNVGGYLYVKFKCIYYNKLDSHLKSASVGIRKIQHVNKGCECPAEILLSWNSSFKAYFIKKYCFFSLYCFFYYLFFNTFVYVHTNPYS